MPKIKLSDLVQLMTDAQYRTLRDGGVPEDQLATADSAFYQRVREQVTFTKNGPALPLQLNYLASRDVELDVQSPSYAQCRRAIRTLAKMDGTDKRYLRIIAAYEADNKARNSRKRSDTKSEDQSDDKSDITPDRVSDEFPDVVSDTKPEQKPAVRLTEDELMRLIAQPITEDESKAFWNSST